MARRRVLAALTVATAVAALAGCGGDDDPAATGPGADEAVSTVQDFLVAGAEGDEQTACDLLIPEYKALLEDTTPCEDLVAVQAESAEKGNAEFDSEPIDPDDIDALGLQATVAEDGQTATVTGPAGKQQIQLQLLNGEWRIAGVSAPS